MEREIIFRGKRVESGRWEFGYFAECVEPMDEPVVLSYITDIENNSFIVYRETVSQYTGLKDSTGKRIFEGDIVKVRDPYSGCWSVNGGEVIFSTEYVGGWVLTSNGKDGLNIRKVFIDDVSCATNKENLKPIQGFSEFMNGKQYGDRQKEYLLNLQKTQRMEIR